MKKLILGTLVACTGTLGYSQSQQLRDIEMETTIDVLNKKAELTVDMGSTRRGSSASTPSTATGTVIFHETFGNGLAGDGSNGAWTTNGVPTAAKWEYRGASTTPANTVGSRGNYAGPNQTPGQPIASPTRANGFFIFDSDYLDNGGGGGATGSGTAPAPHTGYLVSPTIDLSSYPNLIIEVHSYYRKYASKPIIEFSKDNGATWGNEIELYSNVSINQATSNDDTKAIYVPTGVGGNAQVKIRFKFDGTPSASSGSGYYFWQLDDVRLIEGPKNDIAIEQIFFNYPDTNSKFYHYSRIPLKHAPKDSIRAGHSFKNLGSVVQPNVKTKLEVTTPSGTVTRTSTASVASLALNAVDSLSTGLYMPTAGVGNYTYKFYTVSDSTDGNNPNDTILRNFAVTPNTYAWSTRSSSGIRPSAASNSYEMCSYFDIYENDKATRMSVEFSHSSGSADNLKKGDILAFRIFKSSDMSNGTLNGSAYAEYNFCDSKFYSVKTSDLGNRITVPLTHTSTHSQLTPGGYYVCVESFNAKAFVRVDNTLSNDVRRGTTVVDNDKANSFGTFASVPTIILHTDSGTDSCQNVTINPNLSKIDNQPKGQVAANATGGQAPYCYKWNTPSGAAEGDTLKNLNKQGNYEVTVTDFWGCTKTGSIAVGGKVNVQENASFAKNVSFFPNPSNGVFTISVEGLTESFEVSVKNVVGQTVYNGTLIANGSVQKQITIDNAEAGLYFIDLKNKGGEKLTYKMIIK